MEKNAPESEQVSLSIVYTLSETSGGYTTNRRIYKMICPMGTVLFSEMTVIGPNNVSNSNSSVFIPRN